MLRLRSAEGFDFAQPERMGEITMDRRDLLIGATFPAISATATKAAPANEAIPTHYRTSDPTAILAAAKALIRKDSFTTLITVDPQGRPRARTVLVSAPDDDFMLWMATRPGSRKLDQIAKSRAATLHFNDDQSAAYASLMGEVRAIRDETLIATKNPYKGALLKQFFPDFPKDFVLLGFKPFWLEIATLEIAARDDTWQPQGLTID